MCDILRRFRYRKELGTALGGFGNVRPSGEEHPHTIRQTLLIPLLKHVDGGTEATLRIKAVPLQSGSVVAMRRHAKDTLGLPVPKFERSGGIIESERREVQTSEPAGVELAQKLAVRAKDCQLDLESPREDSRPNVRSDPLWC